MDRVTLTFSVCVLLFCTVFGVAFAAHQWPNETDGYGFSSEVGAAFVQEAGDQSPR